jgi:ribosomal protein S18 acetylase RimI-like enzyme
MTDLISYKNRDEVLELLAASVSREADRVLAAFEAYEHNEHAMLLGQIRNDLLIGLIGFINNGDDAVIKHLAVKEGLRGFGIGKQMILDAIEKYAIRKIIAETDIDAVEFYPRVGFEITSLGEKYPGRERFLCVWVA